MLSAKRKFFMDSSHVNFALRLLQQRNNSNDDEKKKKKKEARNSIHEKRQTQDESF